MKDSIGCPNCHGLDTWGWDGTKWMKWSEIPAPARPDTELFGETMYRIHSGCFVNLKEIVAIWSEKYSDPKLDDECYLVRSFLKNNSTILTLANISSKEEADALIKCWVGLE